ncbi:Fatty-acid amide hydrolase 2-A, partial [Gryllus bimaculatus]
VTSEAAVQAYVARIRAVNPHLNAVVEERFDAALEEARAVDRELASAPAPADADAHAQRLARDRPLLGVPITVKESCGLKGMSHCVGTMRRRGLKAADDGAAVAHLREAGAIPLCVTTTPELCLGWETNNLCVGIFGHKPSPALVPVAGHYPMSDDPNFLRFLVLGPMCRYAEDLRLGLVAMAGDAASALRLHEEVDVGQLRVFFMESAPTTWLSVPTDREIRQRISRAARYLQEHHKADVRKTDIQDFIDGVEIGGSAFFAMSGIPDLLIDPVNPKNRRNLWLESFKCIIGQSDISPQAMGFTFLQNVNLFIPQKRMSYYQQMGKALTAKFVEMLGEDGVFLFPTFPTDANFHNEIFVNIPGVQYLMIFNILGLPSTHVPLGLNKNGMPIGLQVVAAPNQDRLCLAVAEALEKGFGGWEPPPAAV